MNKNIYLPHRLSKFAIVGALGTVVYYAALWGMVEHLGIPVLWASSTAFLLVVTENYLLHYLWTFNSTEDHAVALPRFLFMSAMGFGINWVIMYMGVQWQGIHYLLVQAVAIGAVVTWNFLLSSLWIFRSSLKHTGEHSARP